MARTVLDVDRDLLEQAKTLMQQPSLTATINEALRRVVASYALDDALAYFEGMDEDQQQALAGARGQW